MNRNEQIWCHRIAARDEAIVIQNLRKESVDSKKKGLLKEAQERRESHHGVIKILQKNASGMKSIK